MLIDKHDMVSTAGVLLTIRTSFKDFVWYRFRSFLHFVGQNVDTNDMLQ